MATVLVLGLGWNLAYQPAPEPAQWEIDPDAELTAESTRIPIRVLEQRCNSGQTAEGRVISDVAYAPDAVTIEISVRPRRGDQSCQGNPVTPHVVELREPLGDRVIQGEQPIEERGH